MSPPLKAPEFPTRTELQLAGYSASQLELYDLWLHANAEAQMLASRIPNLFGDPPRPQVTLHVADGLDDEWVISTARRDELAALDPEQHWHEVTDQALVGRHAYFTFADAEGWRFYFPAFLHHFLTRFPLADSSVVLDVCNSRKRHKVFTTEQLGLMDEVLELCKTWE